MGTENPYTLRLAQVLTILCATVVLLALRPAEAQQTITISGIQYVLHDGTWYATWEGRGEFAIDPTSLTIQIDPAIPPGQAKALLDELGKKQGFDVLRTNVLGYSDIELHAGRDPIEAARQLDEDKSVVHVEINSSGKFELNGLPNDPRFNEQWHLYAMRVPAAIQPRAWGRVTGSREVTVALIDTGLDIDHEDLQSSVWINPGEAIDGDGSLASPEPNGVDDDANGYTDDFHGWNFIDGTNQIPRDAPHGTLMGGIVAAITNNHKGISGVAGGEDGGGGVRLMAIAIGEGAPASQHVDDAILYAVSVGADVILMAFTVGEYPTIGAALGFASEAGATLMVAAAGSESYVGYPARDPRVVATSAMLPDGTPEFSASGVEIELSAPGFDVLSTSPEGQYEPASGTSVAAAAVVGVAALMVSCNGWLTPFEVRDALRAGAVDLAPPGRDVVYGHGAVDAQASLEQVTCIP